MRFGIVANRKRAGAAKIIARVIEWISAQGHDFRVCEELKDFGVKPEQIVKRDDLAAYCDYII
jgi:hypothetical protein